MVAFLLVALLAVVLAAMFADSTIDGSLVGFFPPNWPHRVVNKVQMLDGFLLDPTTHNVSTQEVQVGSVMTKWNDYNASKGVYGWSQFIYLQVGTQNASELLAAKSFVVPDSATLWYQVTNDPDSNLAIPDGLWAMALSAMTDAYFGWFFCGGVIPSDMIRNAAGTYVLDGTLVTDDNVVAGAVCMHNLDADVIGLGPVDPTAKEVAIGYALASDT